MADRADSLAAASSDRKQREEYAGVAQLARQRLQEGDLKVGDRVLLEVVNFSGLNDTLTVRSGRILQIRTLPGDIPVRGVLWAELPDHLTREIAKYNREPQVRTFPLIVVAVSGAVAGPGFRTVRMDAVLHELITMSGGLAADANLNGSLIRRGRDVRWGKSSTTTAIRDSWSLDSLQLISGDEFVVGRRPPSRFATLVSTVTSISALAIAIVSLRRLR
jgi:protein involved in polysaccharide export with SLBB domain